MEPSCEALRRYGMAETSKKECFYGQNAESWLTIADHTCPVLALLLGVVPFVEYDRWARGHVGRAGGEQLERVLGALNSFRIS